MRCYKPVHDLQLRAVYCRRDDVGRVRGNRKKDLVELSGFVSQHVASRRFPTF